MCDPEQVHSAPPYSWPKKETLTDPTLSDHCEVQTDGCKGLRVVSGTGKGLSQTQRGDATHLLEVPQSRGELCAGGFKPRPAPLLAGAEPNPSGDGDPPQGSYGRGLERGLANASLLPVFVKKKKKFHWHTTIPIIQGGFELQQQS